MSQKKPKPQSLPKVPKPVTIDFETYAIGPRPDYPPKPVGVSIKYFGKNPKYYAWGHATKNNCSLSDAKKALETAWKNPDGVLCQNAKFDVDVAETHFGLPPLTWDKVHDTLFLLFLDDPNQQELGLKPSSERLLDMPPDEQDELGAWFLKNQPVDGVKISASPKSPNYYMKFLPYSPGDLAGKYANGDVIRTELLFALLYKKTCERGMLNAYDRERKLMPILLEMERHGLAVDLKRLRHDHEMYSNCSIIIDEWIYGRLKTRININSSAELMAAMIAAGKVDADVMPRTPTGKIQTNKDALLIGVTDKVLLAVLKYRAQLNTCLHTFIEPWLKVAEKSKGFIYTTWNQTKTPSNGGQMGTRTGRLSSTPNFQNMPKEFRPIFHHEDTKAKLPKCPAKLNLPPLPQCRCYILPFKGHVIIDRDYSQQEPRILAHFENGSLMNNYLADNWMDIHDSAKAELAEIGKVYDRGPVKAVNLGLIYGQGVPSLAAKIGMPVDETKALKSSILALYPGLKDMYKDMKSLAKSGLPIRTWGGREYYCEEPKLVKNRMQHFDYKMVNTLIQGSAADCTKEAIVRFHAQKKADWKILLNVHDQISVSVPAKDLVKSMETLRLCMESVEFDVPILSEGSTSSTNWGELKPYDKKGKRV
jgi:DNA polymerase I